MKTLKLLMVALLLMVACTLGLAVLMYRDHQERLTEQHTQEEKTRQFFTTEDVPDPVAKDWGIYSK